MINKIFQNPYSNIKQKKQVSFQARPISPECAKAYIQAIKDLRAKTIYISGHTSLDDDALCSEHLLAHILKPMGINAKICAKSEQLNTLFLSKSKEIHRNLRKIPELILTVDFNDTLKIPKLLRHMFEGKGEKIADYKDGIFNGTKIIGIDHHLLTNRLKGDFYIDDSAKSCCGILVRFADALGYKLTKEDAKTAYCGILSDYRKSSMVEIKDKNVIYKDTLLNDKNSIEVLEKVEKLLTKKEKHEVYNYLDVMAKLTNKEKSFFNSLESKTKFSKNGRLAYTVIEPSDKNWAEIGMDTDASSFFMREFRLNMLKKHPQIENVAIFYRTSTKPHGVYRVSIHSSDNSAKKLIEAAETFAGKQLGGGHSHRGGGFTPHLDEENIQKFVSYFVQAAEKL